jgi:hypothetical protein
MLSPASHRVRIRTGEKEFGVVPGIVAARRLYEPDFGAMVADRTKSEAITRWSPEIFAVTDEPAARSTLASSKHHRTVAKELDPDRRAANRQL